MFQLLPEKLNAFALDGYIVLTESDFESSLALQKQDARDKVNAAIKQWRYRFFNFLTWKHQNPSASYNGLAYNNMYESDCKLNIGALLTVKGCKIYKWSENTVIPTLRNTQFVYDNNKMDSINIDQINREFSFGITLLDACSGYLGVSIVFRQPHLSFKNIIPGAFCISTGMHELAHLWNFDGSTNSTLPTDEDQHHAYVKGFDSDYCLMRISPSFGSDYEGFYLKQIESMKFSDGVEQRLTNTMIYKR